MRNCGSGLEMQTQGLSGWNVTLLWNGQQSASVCQVFVFRSPKCFLSPLHSLARGSHMPGQGLVSSALMSSALGSLWRCYDHPVP